MSARILRGLATAALALTLAVPALAQDAPVYGGKVTINVHADAPNFDPLASTEYAVHSRLGLALSRLVTWTTGEGITQFIAAPSLADSWEISEDGLTYTFHLNPDIVWQDVAPVSGRPFVAADVVATYEAIRAGGVQKGLLSAVDTITAADDHTVVITLTRPDVTLIQSLAHQNMWILPQEAFDGGYDRNTTVIGTGPFILVADEAGVSTRYERNPTYFGKAENGDQLPYLDEVEVTPIKDLNARILAFRSGQIDIWYGPLNVGQMEEIKNALPGVNDIRTISGNQSELFLNTADPILADVNVRKALNLAIDRLALGDVVRGGGAIGGVVGPAVTGQTLSEEERIATYGTPDIEEAKRLLADAGHADGFPLELTVLNYGEEFVREAEWIQQDLAEIGVEATLKLVDTGAGQALATEGNFQSLFLIMSPLTEANEYFTTHYVPGGNRNYTKLDNAELTAAIVAQQAIVDVDARNEAIHEIQRTIADTVANPLPIWAPLLLHPTQARVHAYYPVPSQGFPSLAGVYVTD